MDFTAIDFETANAKRASACSLALTVVRNNVITDRFYSLINPQMPFAARNTQIHGLTAADVADAPTFAELWPHIAALFGPEQIIVAHNAPFDCSVLQHTLTHYGITPPHFLVIDTVKTSRQLMPNLTNHKLNTVSAALHVTLEHHHNALDDCVACAQILLAQVNQYGTQQIVPFITEK